MTDAARLAALEAENTALRARAVVAEQHKLLDRLGRSSYQEVVEDQLRERLAVAELRAEAAEAKVDALLTAPSSPNALAYCQSCGEFLTHGHECVAALTARLQSLTGYVQHKPECNALPACENPHCVWPPHKSLNPCTCGLADLLTPASAEETEKP